MSRIPVPVTAALLLAVAPGAAAADRDDDPSARGMTRVAQLLIQQRIMVRVRPPAPRPLRWVEKKGPKCLPLDTLAGALVVQPDAVDLVFDGGDRVRAKLEKQCPALNFYAGFYLKPNRDGKVCADRDAVHSRAGRTCEIEAFRKLVAKP